MSNHEAMPSPETESVEVYKESLQRIADGIKLFREKVVERYKPLFSRLSEKYRVSHVFDFEIRRDSFFFYDKFGESQNRDLFKFKLDGFEEEIKKIILPKCPPAPGEISSDELGEILGKTKDDKQVESENELFFGEALEVVASGLSDFEELFKERMLEKVYQYYPETESIRKNSLVVSIVEREIENLKTFMARNGLNAHLEIAGNLSSAVDLILEYLEDQCLNKKHNEDSEKRLGILAIETKPACQPIVEAIRKINGDESRQVTADELLLAGVTRDQFSKLEELYGLKLLDLDEDGRVGFWLDEENRELKMVFLIKRIDEDYKTGEKDERYIPDRFFEIPEAF